MAKQTIQLPGSAFEVVTNHTRWSFTSARPQISAEISPAGQTRYLRLISFLPDGRVSLTIDDQPTGGGTSTQDDLSSQFEMTGSLTVVAGNRALTVNLAGADPSDPYFWTPANSAEVRAFNAALRTQSNVAATLTLDDGAVPGQYKYTLIAGSRSAGLTGFFRGGESGTWNGETTTTLDVGDLSWPLVQWETALGEFVVSVGGAANTLAMANADLLIDLGNGTTPFRTSAMRNTGTQLRMLGVTNYTRGQTYTVTISDLPAPTHCQEINLPGSAFFKSGDFLVWRPDLRPQIDAGLTDATPAYLAQLAVSSTGRVTADFTPTSTTVGRADLSTRFEQNGVVTIAAGGETLTFNTAGGDSQDPYSWAPTNAAEVRAFYAALSSRSGLAATLTLCDSPKPEPTEDSAWSARSNTLVPPPTEDSLWSARSNQLDPPVTTDSDWSARSNVLEPPKPTSCTFDLTAAPIGGSGAAGVFGGLGETCVIGDNTYEITHLFTHGNGIQFRFANVNQAQAFIDADLEVNPGISGQQPFRTGLMSFDVARAWAQYAAYPGRFVAGTTYTINIREAPPATTDSEWSSRSPALAPPAATSDSQWSSRSATLSPPAITADSEWSDRSSTLSPPTQDSDWSPRSRTLRPPESDRRQNLLPGLVVLSALLGVPLDIDSETLAELYYGDTPLLQPRIRDDEGEITQQGINIIRQGTPAEIKADSPDDEIRWWSPLTLSELLEMVTPSTDRFVDRLNVTLSGRKVIITLGRTGGLSSLVGMFDLPGDNYVTDLGIRLLSSPFGTYELDMEATRSGSLGKLSDSVDVTDLVRRATPGTIVRWAGATTPTYWFKCDGAAYSRTTYANLFRSIGTKYGAGDGSTTFNVPNIPSANNTDFIIAY